MHVWTTLVRLDIDFQTIKNSLLKEINLKEFISDPDTEEEALLIYWAVDSLSRDYDQLTSEKKERYVQNKVKLEEIRKKVLSEELRLSLSQYSHGFVLGALEFSARELEASIKHFPEYSQIVRKMESWKDLGFPSERFKKHWEHAMTGIREIQTWLKDRSDAYFPIIAAIIRSGKYKSPLKFLKALRKGATDKIAFQILSSLLLTNPMLHELLVDVCRDETLTISTFISHSISTLELLKEETTDMKVKDYSQLILGKLATSF
jgi:hypothetical protein